jgi:hypothetical protein
VHAAGEFRQEVGFFHGRIAAADHRDFLAAKKISVAGRAGRNAAAHQLFFAFESE